MRTKGTLKITLKTTLWTATLVGTACFSEQPIVVPNVIAGSSGEMQHVQTDGGDDGATEPIDEATDTASASGGEVPPDAGITEPTTDDTGNAPLACGNAIVEADEECDDGNRLNGDGCSAECFAETAGCSAGAVVIAESLERGIAVCSDPAEQTCEQDFAALCAPGWHLCSPTEHQAKNDEWEVDLLGRRALGAIRCRSSGGAGHYTVLTTAADSTDNCEIGSSRPACPSAFGCNETFDAALCCARLPSCGDGVVDPPFEECDDANVDEDDDCTVDCTATFGTGPYC